METLIHCIPLPIVYLCRQRTTHLGSRMPRRIGLVNLAGLSMDLLSRPLEKSSGGGSLNGLNLMSRIGASLFLVFLWRHSDIRPWFLQCRLGHPVLRCFLYLRGLISYDITWASLLFSNSCVFTSGPRGVTFISLVTRMSAAYMRQRFRGYLTLHRRQAKTRPFRSYFAMDIPSPTLTGLSDDDSWDSPVFSDDDTDLMLDFAEESYPSQSQSSNSSDDATSSAIPSDITLDFDCEMEAEISRSEDLDFDSDVDDTEPE